jgi:hypothetical protein
MKRIKKLPYLESVAKRSTFADVSFSTVPGNDFTNGKHGRAKSKRGGKKYLNSRIRFHENQQVKKIQKEMENANLE